MRQEPEAKASLLSFAWKGLRTSLELATVLIPTYVAVHFLRAYGLVDYLNHYLTPVVQFVGLRGELSVPLVAGYLGNIYFALGAAAALPLTAREATILALMLGMCHSLIIEGAVLQKAGVSSLKVTGWRLLASLAAGGLINSLWRVG